MKTDHINEEKLALFDELVELCEGNNVCDLCGFKMKHDGFRNDNSICRLGNKVSCPAHMAGEAYALFAKIGAYRKGGKK